MINERRRKELDTRVCRDIGYLLRILLDSIEAGVLEDRIENLEKPQELKINYPVYSESDERLIIKHLRSIERQAPPVMCKDLWRFPLEWGNGNKYGKNNQRGAFEMAFRIQEGW